MLQRIGESVSQGIAQGVELALRGGAAPLVFGLRWHGWRRLEGPRAGAPDGPVRRGGLAIAGKIALDELFFATEIVSAALVAPGAQRRVAREVEEGLAHFGAEGWLAQPDSYHETPPPLAPGDVVLRDARSRFGDHRHVSWDSGYAPRVGEPGRARWLGYEATRTAHAWLLEHPDGPRPWILCVPGYRMGHPSVDLTGFRARWLHRTLGMNVAIPVLPLHGPRRVGRRGGDGWFAGDFLDTIHAQAQAVFDLRRLVGWLRARGAPGVGVYGVSLGGHTSALLASLDADLACVIAGIPAADLLRLLRAHVPAPLLRAATRFGLDLDAAARLLRVVSPLHFTPRVPHGRRFLYAGTADRLADPSHALDLWRHWERPRLAWYHGGHVSFLWESAVESLLLEAFAASGLLSRQAR